MFTTRSRLGAVISQQENRHATAGCLLSLLLFLPYFTRLYNPLLLYCLGLLYAFFIVPLLLSYFTISTCLKSAGWIATCLTQFARQIVIRVRHFVISALYFAYLFHRVFIQVDPLQLIANQAVFFTIVEKTICPEQHLLCLHSLLFFNILAYLKRSLQDRPWSRFANMSGPGQLLQTTVTFTILKLAKSVVLTMVLMLFTIRIPNYQPNFSYLSITGIYFIITAPGFEKRLVHVLKTYELDLMEGMEEIWCPLITKFVSFTYSTVFMIKAFPLDGLLVFVACYTNVFVDYVKFSEYLLPKLREERSFLNRYASSLLGKSEMNKLGIDPTCAICLDSMTFARLTPCRHPFHGHCLRRWLKQNSCCPLCKQSLN